MAGVARNGVDNAGGGNLIASQSTVTVNNQAVIVNGDRVDGHGISPHDNATMVATGFSNVYVGGAKIVVAGDLATCAHSCSGSGNVNVG